MWFVTFEEIGRPVVSNPNDLHAPLAFDWRTGLNRSRRVRVGHCCAGRRFARRAVPDDDRNVVGDWGRDLPQVGA